MLPNKMKISESATNSLRRFQANTGLTMNIGARLALLESIENGYRYSIDSETPNSAGRELEKHTWLGNLSDVLEILLKATYPDYTQKQLLTAWSAHVENGASRLENMKNIHALYLHLVY